MENILKKIGGASYYDGLYGTSQSGFTDSRCTYAFTGRRIDSLDDGDLTLQYNRNRYYSQTLGRWYSQDKMDYIDSMNVYSYLKNNPLKNLDPFGLMSIRIPIDPPCPYNPPVPGYHIPYWENDGPRYSVGGAIKNMCKSDTAPEPTKCLKGWDYENVRRIYFEDKKSVISYEGWTYDFACENAKRTKITKTKAVRVVYRYICCNGKLRKFLEFKDTVLCTEWRQDQIMKYLNLDDYKDNRMIAGIISVTIRF